MKINNALFKQKLHDQKFLIMVHRGSHGGNIIENTSEAVKVSKIQHADVVELDISKSTDGDFFVFHDGDEKRLLDEVRNIKKLSTTEIKEKFFFNSLAEKINFKVEEFQELYKKIDHQTFLNIDRSWEYWETFLPFLDQFTEMHEYFVLKSPPKREYLQLLNDHKIKYLYFPIITDLTQLEMLNEFPDLNIVGLELIETTPNLDLLKSEQVQNYRQGGYMILANSIKLNSQLNLFSGLDDNLALLDSPDVVWKIMLKHGVNAIQTDWPGIIYEYRKKDHSNE